jgi:hypothetical protein
MSPKRIQRKRTKGWRMPEGAIYVGRPRRRLADKYVPKEPDALLRAARDLVYADETGVDEDAAEARAELVRLTTAELREEIAGLERELQRCQEGHLA